MGCTVLWVSLLLSSDVVSAEVDSSASSEVEGEVVVGAVVVASVEIVELSLSLPQAVKQIINVNVSKIDTAFFIIFLSTLVLTDCKES